MIFPPVDGPVQKFGHQVEKLRKVHDDSEWELVKGKRIRFLMKWTSERSSGTRRTSLVSRGSYRKELEPEKVSRRRKCWGWGGWGSVDTRTSRGAILYKLVT